jgi:uncharacterized tellurite resistance protein B-like protein
MEEIKRKSSRSFELEKGGKRSFDLNKSSARKFDLAKESDDVSLEELKKELLADGKIDAEEVNKLREVLYADGKIDQEEADFLFELNDAVSDQANDPSWKAFFVEAITDYLLNDEKSPGVIDEEEGKWLEEKINNDGKLDTVERALVASLRRKSKSMPQSLNAIMSQVAIRFKLEKDEVPVEEAAAAAKALAEAKAEAEKSANKKEDNETDLAQLKKEVLADGKIDKEEVELLRKALYADGKIDQEEADFLFELNDVVSGKQNDSSWNKFFIEAISDYLLNDEKSPGVIDDEEGKWLVEKIGADGQVDGVEKQLLNHLKTNAKKMPVAVTALITGTSNANAVSSGQMNLQQLKKELLADGKIDAEEVKKLREVLYADGKIDQEEADFLFELNDAVSGKQNDSSWNQFFIEAISDYLLNDEKSPGVIDDEEGKWLVGKIGADGQVDGVEKQLLINLKESAKSMPSSVISLIGSDKNRTENPATDGKPNTKGKEPKSMMWLWIVLALVVAAGIAFFCMKSCNTDNDGQSTNQVVAGLTDEKDNQTSVIGDSIDKDLVNQEETIPGSISDEAVSDEDIIDNEQVSDKANDAVIQSNEEQQRIENTSSNKKNTPVKSSDKEGFETPKNIDASASQATSVDESLDKMALDVIRGLYGNGEERKQKLGDSYRTIQNIVNDMYRKGLVK